MHRIDTPRTSLRLASALIGAGWALGAAASAQAITPGQLLAGYTAQAGASASAARGQQLFTQRHGREWSCASCHGDSAIGIGKHASTGKPIKPLAPAAEPSRFADDAKVEKWFRRNCNDVMGRECSAGEKADVLAWLMTLKP